MRLNLAFMAKTFWVALSALPVTLGLAVTALLIALPLGFVMALCRMYRVKGLRQLVIVFVSFTRGTPIVLQILIIYSLLPSLLNALVKQWGLPLNVFDLNPLVYAAAVFSLNNAAALSEIFRSALLAVDRGQLEAALATGLSRMQAYRRIVIPQAMVSALPNICNLTISLIKNTSLAFLMTVKDVTAAARIAASYGYNYIEAYLDIFVIYIVICGVTQRLFDALERKAGCWA